MIAFTAIFFSAYIITNLFFNNRGSALLLVISVQLYFFPTIAGVLGILRPYPLITLTFVVLFISMLVWMLKWQGANDLDEITYIPINYSCRPITLEVLIVLVPVIFSLSWISIFILQSVKHKIAHYYIPPFSWDVVEYHFPHLVNAIQSGSLWTTIWAHYPMGCEMFHSWGFIFLRNDSLVYVTHFFFSIVFIFFSCFILHILCFQDRKALSGTEIIAFLLMTVMLLLTPPLWDMHFNQIGKNDIAMSAFIMAALCFVLQCINDTTTSRFFRQNILLIGIALGIISGIKPHGLLYSAFFLGILLKDSLFKKASWYPVGVVGLLLFILAAFWYIRPLIMIKTIPPASFDQTVFYNLKKGLQLFLNGRENILFSLSIIFCLIMGVIWYKKDFKMSMVNYTLAASIIIFFVTPFSVLNRTEMQLRLAPATIPLVIIIAVATFLRLIVKAGEEKKAYQLNEPNAGFFRRQVIWAFVSIGICLLALMAISRMGGLASKPRWAWNLRGLIIVGFLAASLYIYNSVEALKDYKLRISRSLFPVISFFIVLITISIQIISYKPPGDLTGYNENTSVYRWVYQNIRGKTICLLGLRPYGLYGKELSNRVIYGGDSHGTHLEDWLSLIKKQHIDYLVIGRDYAQHQGWYNYLPFPSDVAKILAMPNFFKLVWSDNGAMIFSIEPSFYCSQRAT
jgi:hypothetical protein